MLLSAAAGFAAALFWLRGAPPPLRLVEPKPAAHLTLATGLVEVRREGVDWQPLSTGGDVPARTLVRTASGARCEFRLADGSQIRLNESTEISLHNTRQVELLRGQVWTKAGAGTVPYELVVRDTRIAAGSTTFDVLAELASIQLTVMHGVARVRAGAAERTVVAGQQLAVADGMPGEPTPADNLVAATRWLHELLMLKGRGDPELALRIDDLFAQIGETKMDYVYEQDIRALGDHCVLPLVRYIESDRSLTDPRKRGQAARIVSDVAQPWCIPELIELLGDADGEVRYHAARALTRLTGESFGRDPDSWRDAPSEACEPTVSRWHAWWDANRRRFPGAASSPARAQGGP